MSVEKRLLKTFISPEDLSEFSVGYQDEMNAYIKLKGVQIPSDKDFYLLNPLQYVSFNVLMV